MKACMIDAFGGRDRLTVTDLSTPEAGEGEVLVRIRAAGVNPVDWKIREGWLKDLFPHRLPLIPGWDMAGVVEAVGHAARRFAPGDEVWAYARRPVIQYGTYAEYIALPESYVARKPANLSMEEAASIPLVSLTAFQALFDAGRLTAGESVLILGASGGVGTSAVQLAAEKGCRVAGLAGPRSQAYMRSLGAGLPIDYDDGDFVARLKDAMPDGVDLVFDCHGGDTLRRALGCVRAGGRLVSITETLDEAALKGTDLRFAFTFVEPHVPQLDYLRGLIEAGRMKAHVTQTFPLDRVAEAHAAMESGHTQGKIVLRI